VLVHVGDSLLKIIRMSLQLLNPYFVRFGFKISKKSPERMANLTLHDKYSFH
jgi:hypothetical protein